MYYKQPRRNIRYVCFALLIVLMQRGSSAYIITPITKIIYNNHRHSFHGKHLVGFPSASLRDIRIWAQSDGNDASVNVDEPDEDRRDNNYKWSAQTFAIALPALAGMMTDPILSMVDTLFVGQLGVTSTMMSTTKAAATAASPSSTSSIPLAALGACTSIFHLAFHCVKGTTATTASLVAGAVVRDEQKQQADEKGITQKETTLIAQTSMQQAFITGTVISLFLLAFGTKCLNAMGIPKSSTLLFSSAFSYLNYRAVAAPAVVLLTASEGIFRGFGDVITPWKVSLVVAGLNLVLDPFCMFHKQTGMGMMGLGMGIKGAAVATSFSQLCGALLYGSLLLRKGVLRSNGEGGSIPKIAWKKLKQIVSRNSDDSAELKQKKRAIALTILRANAAMILKQGSLLLGWAYATSRATRMGHSIVAAHQMGLSIWMLFSYALDGISVAAQVLMAREYEELRIVEKNSDEKFAGQQKKVRSLSVYMMVASLIQGLIVSAAVLLLYKLQPSFILTNDPAVRTNLLQLFPHLSAQMTLVSATLVAEALTVGGGRFKWLAFGTTVSSLVAMTRLRLSTSLIGIWSGGIVSLFLGRLITALLAVLDMNGFIPRRKALVAEEEAE
jgi:Na+-driven multidrug efflux pump